VILVSKCIDYAIVGVRLVRPIVVGPEGNTLYFTTLHTRSIYKINIDGSSKITVFSPTYVQERTRSIVVDPLHGNVTELAE